LRPSFSIGLDKDHGWSHQFDDRFQDGRLGLNDGGVPSEFCLKLPATFWRKDASLLETGGQGRLSQEARGGEKKERACGKAG
jgi:hypothetical protein